MSAQQGASGSGTTYGAYAVLRGDAASGSDGRIGLVIDDVDGATQLRLGTLERLEPEARAGDRRILAVDRAAAPDWLARLDELHVVVPSPLIALIANLADTLTDIGPDIGAEDVSAMIDSILLLARTAWERPTMAAVPQGTSDAPEMIAATRLIEERLLDPTLGADSLTHALGLSRSSLYRAFQPHGGVNAWIRQRRLEHAREVLASRTGSRPTVGEVAHACGFASDSHFSRAYRKAFGHSPGGRPTDAGSGGA